MPHSRSRTVDFREHAVCSACEVVFYLNPKVAAAIRKTFEETGLEVELTALPGG